jgi:hypothetical protein
MINYNKYFEKVRYKNYQINDEHNLKMLETLDIFNKILSDNNINYILVGSLCLSILSHKIIRTWGDLDVIVEDSVLFKIKDLFKKKATEWELITSHMKLTGLFNLKTNIKVEFVNYAKIKNNYQEKYINNIKLKLSFPYNIFIAKFLRFNYNKKDLDDFKFFRDFINIENPKEIIQMILDRDPFEKNI